MFAVPVNEFDEVRRELGKIRPRLMDDHRFEARGTRGGTSGRAFGGDAFARHQEDGLVVLAGQAGVVAFDEHASRRIGDKAAACKIIMALLETTLKGHKRRANTGDSVQKPGSGGGRSVGGYNGFDILRLLTRTTRQSKRE